MLRFLEHGVSSFGYTIPDMPLLRQECTFINVWESQWISSDEVRDVVSTLRGFLGEPFVNLNLRLRGQIWVGRPEAPRTLGRPSAPCKLHSCRLSSSLMSALANA